MHWYGAEARAAQSLTLRVHIKVGIRVSPWHPVSAVCSGLHLALTEFQHIVVVSCPSLLTHSRSLSTKSLLYRNHSFTGRKHLCIFKIDIYTTMRGIFGFAIAATFGLVGRSLAAPVVKVTPGNAGDIIISNQDTVNATVPAPANSTSTNSTIRLLEEAVATNGQLPLNLVNNVCDFGSDCETSTNLHAHCF